MGLRLDTLAGYYHQSSSIWDIGCDHGLLGLSFVDQPGVESIHLVDPSTDVIRTLQKKLLDSYITKGHLVKIHHQKGQEIQLDSLSKTIFIAGMGGKEILEICKNIIPQLEESDRLVLSPHRNILELRAYLRESPMGLVEERSLKEDGQFYQIFCLEKKKSLTKISSFGEKVWQGIVGEEYRQHIIRAFKPHQDPLSKAFLVYLESLR